MKIKNRRKWLLLNRTGICALGWIITPHRNADFVTTPWLFRRDAKCLTRFHSIRFRIESKVKVNIIRSGELGSHRIVVLVSKLEIFGIPSREWCIITHPQNWETSSPLDFKGSGRVVFGTKTHVVVNFRRGDCTKKQQQKLSSLKFLFIVGNKANTSSRPAPCRSREIAQT